MLFHDHILNSPIMGFAHHRLIIDDEGKPVDYEFLEINKTFEKITGLKKESIIGKTVKDVIPGLETSNFDWINFYGEIALNFGESEFEQYSEPLGKWYRVFAHSAEKYYFTTVFIDITNAKKAEEDLIVAKEKAEDIERKLNDAQQVAKLGSWELDLKSNKLYWSDEIFRIFEIEKSEFSASYDAFLETIHPDDRDFVNEAYIKSVKNKLPYTIEHRLLMKDGRVKFVFEQAKTIYDSNGKAIRSLGTVQDISDRKLAEEQLRKLSQAVEQSPSVVVITDKSGLIEYVNPKFTEITGYTSDEVMGKNPNILKSGDQPKEFYEKMWQTISSGLEWKAEFHNKKKNGELYWENASITSIKNESGEITHYLAVKEDVTERKRFQSELIKTNLELVKANNEKDKFFSIIAHDLRASFNGFLGLTKLMSEKIFDLSMKELRDFSKKLLESSENLFELLENLLSWSQLKRDSMNFSQEIIHLKEVVDICTYMLKPAIENKKQIVEINVNEEIFVLADRRMLDAVIRNLLSNASKFTNAEGKIMINAEVNQNEVVVSINDSGIGIPNNILDKLFTIGEKTSRKGTDDEPSSGLGLILCKEFVEKNNGKLWVESIEGKGSTFFFTVPLGNVEELN